MVASDTWCSPAGLGVCMAVSNISNIFESLESILIIFMIMYLTNYFNVAPRGDSNPGPKAFSLLEFEIAP